MFAEAYLNRGLAYDLKGQPEEAISDFNKALEIKPGYAEAYSGRGAAYVQMFQPDQAISDLNKALEINPKIAEAYVSRGLAYLSKKEIKKSWDDMNKAQELGLQIDAAILDMIRFYETGKAPNEDRLKRRVKDSYTATRKGDYKTRYEMMNPHIRKMMSFEAFKKDMGAERPQQKDEPKIVQGELEKICYCGDWAYKSGPHPLRCVFILRMTMEEAGGNQKVFRVLEMWEHLDGEWYYGYTDHHELEDCPKPF
jgi:tetratricopeptide (TPR) repeat protein